MPASTRRRLRRFVAAAGLAAAATVPTAAPALADTALPCIEVVVDGRSITVCEDMVTAEPCPYPQNGVIIDVMGEVVRHCFVLASD